MKFNIFLKLFLAMLLSMMLVVGAMMASTYWSFRKGLSDYIQKTELERVEALVPVLSQAYQEHGDWDFLRGNREAWIHLLDQGLGKRHGKEGDGPIDMLEPLPPPPLPESGNVDFPILPPPEFGEGLFPPPPPLLEGDKFPPPPPPNTVELSNALQNAPYLNSTTLPPPPYHHHGGHHGGPLPNDPVFLGRRLRLLDASRDYVVGPPYHGDKESFRPVTVGEVTVGWLAVRPVSVFTDRLAISFLEQQKQANLLITLLALGLSILASLILARVFLAPIRRLAAGVQALSAGQYDTHITPSSQDELGQLAHHFNWLAQTLKSNEKARRQWIADIAHELRTPLAILKGEIEAMQDGIRNPSPERIRSLHGEVSALTKLVDDLHELSVSDLGAMNYRREPLNLAELIQEVCGQFRQRFASRGLELINRVDAHADYPVLADPGRLFQLFSNLLENSCRYTDSPGLCEITVDKTEQTYAINFCDSAPGVPNEALGKLFDRLYRVDKSRSRELGGSGLGLSICKNIVEAHGGTITAQHGEHGGVWIRVTLPKYL